MGNYLIRNAKIVNNGLITHGFVLDDNFIISGFALADKCYYRWHYPG